MKTSITLALLALATFAVASPAPKASLLGRQTPDLGGTVTGLLTKAESVGGIGGTLGGTLGSNPLGGALGGGSQAGQGSSGEAGEGASGGAGKGGSGAGKGGSGAGKGGKGGA